MPEAKAHTGLVQLTGSLKSPDYWDVRSRFPRNFPSSRPEPNPGHEQRNRRRNSTVERPDSSFGHKRIQYPTKRYR